MAPVCRRNLRCKIAGEIKDYSQEVVKFVERLKGLWF